MKVGELVNIVNHHKKAEKVLIDSSGLLRFFGGVSALLYFRQRVW